MKLSRLRNTVLALGVTVALGGLASCSSDNGNGGTTPTGTGTGTGTSTGEQSGAIALLLPESATARYEAFDRPLFEAKAKELCPDCKIIYANADQDAAKQQQQAESALTEGVKVMVLDPVDSSGAASIVAAANSQNVPVIAYDRFINGAKLAAYISFDNEKVGELQGTALVKKLDEEGATGGIVMINGSPTDNNAGQFKAGAHKVIDASKYKVLAEYDTPDWEPSKAQEWMAGQITQFDGQIVGVYAANDGTAGGAISALKAAGVNPLPPVTGQDAELAGIQRIVAGDQYMTVYKAIKTEAEKAAELAVDALRGKKLDTPDTFENTPSVLLTPVAVTKDNIKDTVVKDGFYTVDQICTADFAAACKSIGLQ